MKLVIREEAEFDVHAAMTWYAARRDGLEQEFLSALDEVLVFLARWPKAGKRVRGDVRCFPMERFPYDLVYAVRKEELLVIRVFHQRRDPRKILKRKPGRSKRS